MLYSWCGVEKSSAPSSVVASNFSAKPEQAYDARARAWAFVFDCHASKKAGVTSTGDDMREEPQNDSHAEPSVP